ncbi:MAG: hypothetical protein ACPG4Z_08585, partial [Chitinophagales bacterium]
MIKYATRFFLFFSFTIITFSLVQAQEDVSADDAFSLKPKKLIQIGDKLMEEGSNYNAIDYYKAALFATQKKKQQAYLNYQLGQSNFMMRDYKLAEKYYLSAINIDMKNKYPLAVYNLANTYKYQAKYEDAKSTFRSFLTDNDENEKVDVEKRKARLEIKGCDFAIDLQQEKEKYVVENAGNDINGVYSDFGPAFRDGDLFYGKINSQVVVTLNEEQMTDDQYARIYKNGAKEEQIFNQGNSFVGNPTFSANGNTMYYTKCELIYGTRSQCAIYTSEYDDGEWKKEVKLDDNINNADVNTTQPHISTDENGIETLYFVAQDRTNGRGGKDIWFAVKNEEGVFQRARNMGYPINTRYDDVSPFYDENSQILYFSSDGHISIGGLDIFSSQKDEDGDFEEPENMMTPLNSSLDDFDFVLNSEGLVGYLVSNRVGTTTLKSATCCDDIFKVTPSEQKMVLCGLIFEENTRTVSYESSILLKDGDTDEIIEEIDFTGEEFFFDIEPDRTYVLFVSHDSFEAESISINTNGKYKIDTLFQDVLLKNRIEESPVEEIDVVLGKIYYEFNLSKLRADAPDTLAKVLNYMMTHPLCIVEV